MSLLGKWFGFSVDEIFDEGVSAYDRGDYEASTEAFEECLDAATDNATARLAAFYAGESYSQLGSRYCEEGRYDNALRMFRSAIRFCPNYPDLHLKAAQAAHKMENPEERDFHLRAALKINPRYVDALVFSGVCEYEQGLRSNGLDRIADALQMDGDLDRKPYENALSLHESEDYDQALIHLQTLCGDQIRDSAQFKRVGDGFMRDGMVEEAIGAYSRSLAIAPRNVETRCRLAQAFLTEGRLEASLDEIDTALRLNPTAVEAHALRGEVLRLLEREIDARCEFQRTIEIDPNHPVALREKASLL